ncbi:MAG TPA: DUF4428 domain-containing protein [Clostridia bacterium]|nr:DUF4428 domain-containing protein [Clostridia bacterium]
MAFFSKKKCDICDKKIGLLGNRKLEDGNLCKECAKKLSPFFSERRKSTVQDIKEQLAYREENREEVMKFNATRTLGRNTKVILDEDSQKFIVSSSRRWKEENPDVMDYSQVTGCNLRIDETQKERMQKDREGNEISYNPRRYVYSYDFWMTIHVNHPYFDEIKFLINNSTISIEPPTGRVWIQGGSDMGQKSAEYRQCEEIAEEIKVALTQVRENIREDIAASKAPKTVQICPLCGATTTPDVQGRCEFCGGFVMQ